jgi:hypothetical protein
MIFLLGQQSGSLPAQSAISSVKLPGGASNALVDGSTMYVVGQQKMSDGLFGGYLSVVTLPASTGTALTATAPISISDGSPGAVSRMIEGDNNTLWIGMQRCTNGERANHGLPYGCLTMVNIATPTSPTVKLLPYIGDATGIAPITGMKKVYTAEGGQVYIHSTTDGSLLDNEFVTMTGTVYDVAYMDALSDDNNTVY